MLRPSQNDGNGPRCREATQVRPQIPRIAQIAFSCVLGGNPEYRLRGCDIELAMTPHGDRPLVQQLSLQGGLERQPKPIRHSGRLLVTLFWMAILGGLSMSFWSA